ELCLRGLWPLGGVWGDDLLQCGRSLLTQLRELCLAASGRLAIFGATICLVRQKSRFSASQYRSGNQDAARFGTGASCEATDSKEVGDRRPGGFVITRRRPYRNDN